MIGGSAVADGVCTHFTALQIFVPIDNRKMLAETAREMAMVAEYVEQKAPLARVEPLDEDIPFQDVVDSNLPGPSIKQPKGAEPGK